MSSSFSSIKTIKHKIYLNTLKKGKENIENNKKSHIYAQNSLNCQIPSSININQNYSQAKQFYSYIQQQQPITTLRFHNCNPYDDPYQEGQSYNNSSKLFGFQTFTPKWSISDFEILHTLGQGKFGQVYAARQIQSDFIVALKRMSKLQLQQNNFINQVKRQITIQSSLKHQNILKLFGYFWDQSAIYLILEYAPSGQIYGLLKNHKSFSQKNVSVIIRQVLQAVNYLHSHSIIHRDIKPQNLLLSISQVKLADFGWSIHSNKRRDTLCGTLDYLAPQMVKGSTHDASIDIWQVGILAYELTVGHPPFQTKSYDQTYNKIMNQDVKFPQWISYELRKFVRKCLQKKPYKRPSVEQCLKEEFIKNYCQHQLEILR